jgi:heat shock protein HslJ
VFATLLVVMAGTATTAADAPESTGIDWSLGSITMDGTSVEVPDVVSATLRLEAGQATGSGGCNEFFGDYQVDGSALSFGPLAVTQKLCADPQQEVEDAYLPALGMVAYQEIADDGSLHLLDADMQELLAFSRADGGIEDATWLLREQAVDGNLTPIAENLLVSLHLQNGDADGTGGCNRYSSSYVIDDDDIAFGPIASTHMACPGPAGDVEALYFANLASAATWDSDGSTLTFSSLAGDAILEYDAAPAASVVGGWVAQGINDGAESVVSSEMTSAVTAEFASTGDLTGSDGCNEYFTTYEVDGDAISIGPIASTKRACLDDELTAQSQAYQAALGAATTWSVTDTGNLELRDDAGSLQVRFLPAEG